jgi:ribokinase
MGETVAGTSFEKNFGGKGANQALQCQRLGVATAFIGRVGTDSYGSEYIQSFKNEGINTTFFKCAEGTQSGIASIWVDRNGHNSIVIVPGANLHLPVEEINENISTFPKAKIAVFQNEISEYATIEGLKASNDLELLSIFNPAPVSKNCIDLVPLCNILCLNEVELAVLTGRNIDGSDESIADACKYLLSLGCKEVIVTFGSKGAYWINAEVFKHFSAPNVKAIDTVGAGDSFIGTLAANLARGVELTQAIESSVAVASVSVQHRGAQPSYSRVENLPVGLHLPTKRTS